MFKVHLSIFLVCLKNMWPQMIAYILTFLSHHLKLLLLSELQ